MRMLAPILRRARSIAALMVVVAAAAVALTVLRPTDEGRAMEAARAYLERTAPGTYRVSGASFQAPTMVGRPGWVVTYQNVPGNPVGLVYGALLVDSAGRVQLLFVMGG